MIDAGMTTPTTPGKAPRPVWNVRGNVAPWRAMLYDLGGRKWGGGVSFFSDPTEAIARALETTAPESYADRRAGFQDRAEARAERREEWADKARERADHSFGHSRALLDPIPMGQPILVGHHSERRHRRTLERADNAMRRGCEAVKLAEHHEHRAEAAAANAAPDTGRPLAFIGRRIEDATKAIADIERRIARTQQKRDDGADAYGQDPATSDAYRARLALVLADERGKLEYWQGIRAAKMSAEGLTAHSSATIAKGDYVKIRGRWEPVERANRTTVSVPFWIGDGRKASWTLKYPYAEIQGHVTAADAATAANAAGVPLR